MQANLTNYTYDPVSGLISKFGRTLGYIDKSTGYRRIYISGQVYYTVDIAWVLMTGEWPSSTIDHKNRDRADDSWDNLRLASKSQNAANSKMNARNSSGVRGISWDRCNNKWRVTIQVNGKSMNLGRFVDIESAKAAYTKAARQFFGEFACG